MDDFREIVLLNFKAVLRDRMVHDHQLLEDAQVQLCPLDIVELSQKSTGIRQTARLLLLKQWLLLFFTSCSSPSSLLIRNSWIGSTALKIRLSRTAITLSAARSRVSQNISSDLHFFQSQLDRIILKICLAWTYIIRSKCPSLQFR